MSAQALNGSTYAGYIGTVGASNPTGAIPTRDASDITRQIKERLLYLNSKDNTTIVKNKSSLAVGGRSQVNPAGVNHVPGNSEWSWLPYSNQYRLSYFYGKLQLGGTATCNNGCAVGKGAVFNGNGPILPGTTVTVGS